MASVTNIDIMIVHGISELIILMFLDNIFPVGKMEINSISNLTKLNVTSSTKISSHMPSLADVDCSCSDDEDEFGM